MRWLRLPLLAASLPFVAFAGIAQAEAPRISGPAVHENLAIYFIHGKSHAGPVPLTLNEAMKAGAAIVHETGNVNSLSIENTGDREVFVQAGDIVKGGQQDRVLTVSFVVPPKSGRMDIAAYCVEQGRWSARGGENVKQFASSEQALPLREAKLALLTPAKPRTASTAGATTEPVEGARRTLPQGRIDNHVQRGEISDTGTRQREVWSNVAAAQRKLSENLGAPVAAAASASSLQLALENERLAAARKAYAGKLAAAATGDDVIGFVFAIGGKISGGEMYASNALFAKMWAKQLDAAVTEAIAEKNAAPGSVPSVTDVAQFIAKADAAKSAEAALPATSLVRVTRSGDGTLATETRRAAGDLVHRTYLAF